jgi:glycosyltransferase involved in cell wall biosynthesis
MTTTRRICFATPELLGLTRNGGIGASYALLADLLAAHGWDVHVVYCGTEGSADAVRAVRQELAQQGIGLSTVEEGPTSADFRVLGVFPNPCGVGRSEEVLAALRHLCERDRFDLLQFADWPGLGFRPIQAQRNGLAFADLTTVVKLHGMQPWVRELNQQWPASFDTLVGEFGERYAFEHADVQMGASRYILDFARRLGWRVRDDAVACPNPLGAPKCPRVWDTDAAPAEIVFFGRLERRKGYEIFVRAVADLDPTLAITFLGKDTPREAGRPASDWIRERLVGRQLTLLHDHDRTQAISYLSSGNRLAVIPSLAENHSHAVAECMVNGIPFLAAATGGIPETVSCPDLHAHLLFEPTAAALGRRLAAYLSAPAERRRAWHERQLELANVAEHNRAIVAHYERLLANAPRRAVRAEARAAVAAQPPLVTVAVPHHNLGAYLPEALASIAAQTYPRLEVLVIDDGSTDPESHRVFDEEERRYPAFRFLRQTNAGLGATRNRALAEATGEFYLPMDADNVALPELVERLVAALRTNAGCAAVTPYLHWFDDAPASERRIRAAYRGTGGPLALAGIHNVFGDATGLFRTATLRAVGGYDAQREVILEDWHLYVKLIGSGFGVDVLPAPLLLYRIRAGSMVRSGDIYAGQVRVVRELAQAGPLAPAEQLGLWTALASASVQLEDLRQRFHAAEVRYQALVAARPAEPPPPPPVLRYRLADRAAAILRRVPLLQRIGRRVARMLAPAPPPVTPPDPPSAPAA